MAWRSILESKERWTWQCTWDLVDGSQCAKAHGDLNERIHLPRELHRSLFELLPKVVDYNHRDRVFVKWARVYFRDLWRKKERLEKDVLPDSLIVMVNLNPAYAAFPEGGSFCLWKNFEIKDALGRGPKEDPYYRNRVFHLFDFPTARKSLRWDTKYWSTFQSLAEKEQVVFHQKNERFLLIHNILVLFMDPDSLSILYQYALLSIVKVEPDLPQNKSDQEQDKP